MRAFAPCVALSLILGAAPPARAAVAQLLVDDLSITVPAAAILGAGVTGATLSGQLGAVTVADTRDANPKSWIVTVTATGFHTGAGTPAQTISNGQAAYWSGPAIQSTGGGILVPGQLTSAQAQALNVARTAFAKLSGNGNNTVSWHPTLRITVPNTAVAGIYTGTVTHSVG
jgi:hypothetical protein